MEEEKVEQLDSDRKANNAEEHSDKTGRSDNFEFIFIGRNKTKENAKNSKGTKR